MPFPVALTAMGLPVIAAGVYWQRREAIIGAWLRSSLRTPLRELIEHRAGCGPDKLSAATLARSSADIHVRSWHAR